MDPKIILIKNGPLKVDNLSVFKNSRGEPIRCAKTLQLCRCGASKTKPFCDGTHVSIGFSDGKHPDRVADKLDRYDAKDVSILDNRGICSHAGFCTSGLPKVWNMKVEPWIDPHAAPADDIVRIARQCPSGALSYVFGGKTINEFFDDAEIRVTRNGPYAVRGSVQLRGADFLEGASREHYTLCRCGHSRNKPFCDGSHWYTGFKDDEALTIAQANRVTEKATTQWTGVGNAEDLADGQIHSVTVKGKTIALVKTDEGWRAVDGLCPHQGGPLDEGTLGDGSVRCPWHGFDFSLATGKGIGNELVVDTHDVRENEGNVEVATPGPKRSAWTVSHVMVETMIDWGVDTVFGMVGHSNLGLAEAIRVQETRGRMRYIGIRHEGAASFACSGYAKLTGRPAACLSIAGPGATNLLTGLWDAKVDRAPVLALTGQVNTQVMGPGAFQEIDLSSAFAAVARFSQTVLPNSNHAELASLALKTAVVEREVAHLIFPDEVQTLDAGDAGPADRYGRVSGVDIAPPTQSVDHSLYRMARAKRPVIIVGYGARDAMPDVIALAEALKCPVITTFKAKGQISDEHPLAAGVLGRSGTPVASGFMNQSDLLIVFGASFSDHTGIVTTKPIIQVDFERMALGKFHAVDEPVWGDIATTARIFLERLPSSLACIDQHGEVKEQWRMWRDEKAAREDRDDGNGVNSAIVFRELAGTVPDDAVMCVDVGNNTYSFGRYFECKRQSVLMSGYLGSIGFALPAALGAWAAAPQRKIVAVSGDGGLGQYLGEFMTAVKYGMNITHVVLNNSELGKISKEQRDGEWQVWQTGLHNLSFADYAKLCGGAGLRVDSSEDLGDAFHAAINIEGPSLVEVITDPLLT
ncbi:MAG: CDGSH iron-sulfur domain-containing protein [Candidatus Latescibacterota bacterium]|nr:MAG: CDGSH iron-sulfur domain-containing protein [Candidatus Latescibacterota bacterium]